MQSLVDNVLIKRRRKKPNVQQPNPDDILDKSDVPAPNPDGILDTPDVPDDEQIPNTPRKRNSFKYYLKVDGILNQVCRNIFLRVFGISDNRIKRINKCTSHEKRAQ